MLVGMRFLDLFGHFVDEVEEIVAVDATREMLDDAVGFPCAINFWHAGHLQKDSLSIGSTEKSFLPT